DPRHVDVPDAQYGVLIIVSEPRAWRCGSSSNGAAQDRPRRNAWLCKIGTEYTEYGVRMRGFASIDARQGFPQPGNNKRRDVMYGVLRTEYSGLVVRK